MTETVIETRGLTRRFGKTLAVDDLTLQVPRGSVFGFIGRNGAGKTTTIRMLLRLLPMTGGSATVLGFDARIQRISISVSHRRSTTIDELMPRTIATIHTPARRRGSIAGRSSSSLRYYGRCGRTG